MHIGSQSSIPDLDRLYAAAGSEPFDILTDDGSHRPADQLVTLLHTLGQRRVRAGGVYIVEDINLSCVSWRGHECLLDRYGNTTLFGKVVEWQRQLLQGYAPLPGVRHINFYQESVALPIHADTATGATRRQPKAPREPSGRRDGRGRGG